MLPRAFENSCMRRGRMRAGIVKGRDSGEFRGAPIWLGNGRSTMVADNANAHVRDGGTCGSMASLKAQDSISFWCDGLGYRCFIVDRFDTSDL
ncbi:hypothetical protein [Burkholderia vietnamiensis]|uniref:hypothetical protein n=1 Tax=Burkholderia vietnamiensis TaxID=60552 RepID=UPI0015893B62|nr:hypothetical protein [Burkholderia vietnamiensis]MBH9642950.1 hypothetical protein [Burkholderia vietnamiensis]MBR8005740.1 hypothetical protein [Burkholderia vietnamiensis]MBR8188152.1 hypothetical protein [Burkholderia vietnamiensis]MCA8178604.1 hypothetical protein [Burkholderia vietnamiensis]MDN7815589.1 hypothetical protein [Burkholderia vietnamiensis]